MQPQRVTILGDGQMGIVMASLLAQQPDPARICLWGHDARAIESLAQTRRSDRIREVILPDSVRITSRDDEAFADADLIISAVPTQFIRPVWERLRAHAARSPHASIVSVSKGIENSTLLLPIGILQDVLGEPEGQRSYAVLSGPTIAAELARCLPATMVVASTDADLGERVQQLVNTSWMRIYTHEDPVGVEIAGATKNVIAIAAGILDGLKAGDNAKSALLARGLAEITRLGVAMGARTETFFGLAGVGDLATTCFSPMGRNRSLGEALGKGRMLNDLLGETDSVVEGVATTRSVMELADRYEVEMPIAQAVHAVLYEDLDPIDAIAMLMSRPPSAERIG